MKPLFKRFGDGIAFSFWHHWKSLGQPHGTAIIWRRLYPGLFGIRLNRDRYGVHGLQFGIWWTLEFALVAVPLSRFQP